MSIEQNKKVASELFDRFNENDIDGVLNMLADDATWWLPGKPGQIPLVGTQSKEQIARVFQNMGGRLKDGLKMTVKGLVAEGDKVAVEVESYGELKNGRVYNQEYHFLITIRDGKISEVREYLDTQHVLSVWFQPE